MKRKFALLTLLAACGDDAGPPDARGIDAAPPNGSFSLTWSISDGTNPLTCAQVQASLLSLTIRPVDQPFGFSDVLTCSSGQGTIAVPPDTYDIAVSLGGVAVDPIVFDNVTVDAEQDTALGDAAFEVEAVGGFSLTISAGGAGNCAAAGADLSGVRLELETLADVCTPVTFDIAAGATQPAGTYTTDCTTPAAYACIESDQDVIARPTIPTGSYRLRVVGQSGGTDCWLKQAQFDVPAAGEIRDLPVQNLLHDDVTPACQP